MPDPLISVCIPAYNGAQFIRECLESIYSQTYTNLEILISDDDSSDDSLAIINKVINKNTQVYKQKRRLGWVANSNFLIGKSKGTYFSIIPQDDLIPKNYFEILIKGFDNKLVVNCFPYIQCFGNQHGLIDQSSITGTLESRIYNVILNHFWAVSFRGVVKNSIPDPFRFILNNQHQDMMADTIWILQQAIAGELHSIKIAYQKRYHNSGAHMSWIHKPILEKITAWSDHCAALYILASTYVSDREKLYQACLKRLLQNKNYLVEIKTNDYDPLLLNEFNEKIKHVDRK